MPITFTQADVHRDRAALIELNVDGRYGSVDAGYRDPAGNGWKMIQQEGRT